MTGLLLSLAAGLWLAGPAAAQDAPPGESTLIDIQPADEGSFEIGMAGIAGQIVFPRYRTHEIAALATRVPASTCR